jgi:Cd2+/Zn2+-exporting ATPase
MNSDSALKALQAQIGGMDCGGCAKTIEATLQQLPGVAEAKVSFATERLNVTYDAQQVNEVTIRDRVIALGYTLKPMPNQSLPVQLP